MSGAGEAARGAALALLSNCLRKKKPLDTQLGVLDRLSVRDAGFARALAAETLRYLGELDALVRGYVPKPLPAHKAGATLEILLLGACELLILKVAPHAAVDGAVRLAQKDAGAVHFKPLVNAVLRRIAREGEADLAQQDAERLNTPDWLWEGWCAQYGEETTRRIARAHATRAPTDIVLKRPGADAPEGTSLFGNVVRLVDGVPIAEMRGFAEGDWWVQDAAASLPVLLLGDVAGSQVIDLCAAPGGKTMQLAAMGADVVAVEREAARLERVRENLMRTGLSAHLVGSDLRDFKPDAPAPFVLLDAPCTATGTIRRHPDLPWIKSASDVTAQAAAAQELLEAASAMVALGGLLVFAVCSLEREEGPEQVARFLDAHPEFSRVPVAAEELFGHPEWIAGGDLRTLPFQLEGGMDGFYAARLRRSL